MNRNAIKKFAVWARKSLRDEVATNAARFGVTRSSVTEPHYVAGGMVIGAATFDQHTTALYRALRDDLNARLRSKPLEHVVDELVDEMAYTWFNRLAALRFMEVQGYIGRALSSSVPGTTEPDLLRDALSLADTLPGLDVARIDALQAEGDEPLYRALLVAQCKDLEGALPDLFGHTSYAELFLPARLLTQGSFSQRLVQDVPAEDWRDIEIVGWLYQFYISERKDEVFAAKKAYDARDIPAATQLFTPHWIVRYMVENSLGRLWLEAHPESSLRAQMPYYLDSQSENQAEGEQVRGNPNLKPEDLSVLDPACGSGHILVYAFDLLFAVYQEQGYPEPDIPALILEHNLHSLDIDERAAQLTSFALMMKARERSRRILRNPPVLHIAQTVPTRGWALPDVPELNKADWEPLLAAFRDADNLGSLISPPPVDTAALSKQLAAFEASGRMEVSADLPRLQALLKQTALLSRSYLAVVANPPYMGKRYFNPVVKQYVKKHYVDIANDIYGIFIDRCLAATRYEGYLGMITQHSWMFASSFRKLRESILSTGSIVNLVHLGSRAFAEIGGEVVQSTTFVIRKGHLGDPSGNYVRLLDYSSEDEKRKEFFHNKNRFIDVKQKDFYDLPDMPLAYWIDQKIRAIFQRGQRLEDIAAPRRGNTTTNNDRFLRFWVEVSKNKVGVYYSSTMEANSAGKTWLPYNKGGGAKKWFGLNEFLVNWADNGAEIKKIAHSVIANEKHFMEEGVTWSEVSSLMPAFRYLPKGFIFDNTGCTIFSDGKYRNRLLALLNSSVAVEIFKILTPSLHIANGQVGAFPLVNFNQEINLVDVERTVTLGRQDWDNFETSWDFQTHPLLRTPHPRLSAAFTDWQNTAAAAFTELKGLEEENNRYWIDAYGLQDELTPDVPDAQITIRRADLLRDVKSLLSYAVGCMMGRYSLSQPGLQFAGGTFDPSAYSGDFLPDPDGILPITDEAYFGDDVVTRLEAFLRAAYGAEHLQANLTFIADALKRRGDETPRERLRRYFLDEFVSDHIQTYKKRPIYWLFTSGREKGFGALVYLHRYTQDTLATLRNDYVLELQGKLAAELGRVERSREGASARDAKLAERRLKTLRAQQTEVVGFQERLQTLADRYIALDLDDGVAYNYTLFQGVVYEGSDLKLADLLKKSAWKRELLAEAT